MRPKCGMFEPVRETRLAEPRVIARNECALAKLHAVVARVRVSDNLARIFVCGQALRDEFIETKLFRPPYFNGAIHRRARRDPAHRTGDIVSRHRLDERSWQAYCVALGGEIRNALDEFEELRRAENCVRNRGSFDQVLLSHFCAEETACEQAFRSHDRQRDMMLHARSRSVGEKLTG